MGGQARPSGTFAWQQAGGLCHLALPTELLEVRGHPLRWTAQRCELPSLAFPMPRLGSWSPLTVRVKPEAQRGAAR